MTVIPVIDLLQGQVVRALRGDRQHYRPIVSALCASSDPLTVARILCDHVAARQLYIADLDALQGGGGHVAVVRQLLEALPDLELWLDAGFADVSQAQALGAALGPLAQRLVPVFGSESLRSRAALAACFTPPGRGILSLDRRDGQRLDSAGCWDSPALWPSRVIVMTLERVGAGTGPDVDTLREVATRAPHTQLIGAGGIGSEADLALAQASGASAWLVASALHDRKLPRMST
ncbi:MULTISPECIES: HisA/HisF-related TIM barrel protein [unclassified Rhizobacter]|uniref:HisA/HisF-related TIM barrel protein n=1 Tax=unclassified Rhizobacter TaxID=2640088 RepID=UPI0006F5CD8A|nr:MULTISPECIES: HisA/HisF-related TIM barrel protein [unclassified Rhizobacter]KQU77179.1 nickel transporter [Rhizobacter sp. Root29]KQW12794.1 nickel transporter [Rhizobacter sp. Root1238]KRB22382.1 nickel transporter [Rhizobacter sp. Root16D2]